MNYKRVLKTGVLAAAVTIITQRNLTKSPSFRSDFAQLRRIPAAGFRARWLPSDASSRGKGEKIAESPRPFANRTRTNGQTPAA